MLWHIVLKVLDQYAEVWFLSIWFTSQWTSKGSKVVLPGLEEYTMLVIGTVGTVLSRCFVKMWQSSGSVTRTAGSKRWNALSVRIGVFSVSSPLSLYANAERRECAWTEARAPGTWNRVVVEVETRALTFMNCWFGWKHCRPEEKLDWSSSSWSS